MADTFIYEDSNEPQMTLEPFVKKEWVWVIDQNNGSYSGSQILIDSSSLSNSGKYVSYSEAFFTIPIVMRLAATTANAQVAGIQNLRSSFAAGLKNGYYHFLSSVSVEYNNSTVVQLCPNISHYINYKLLTSMSKDSLDKYSGLIGFYPDSVLSARYGAQAVASNIGHGSVNAFNLPQFPASVYSWDVVNDAAYNHGYYMRQLQTSGLDPTAPAPVSAFLSASAAGQVGLNYFRLGTGGDVDSKYWFITAIIRLKDIADFFEKLPILKGAFCRWTLNVNQVTHNFTVTTNGGVVTDVSMVQNILTGGSSPVLLANASKSGNGFFEIGQTLAGLGNATYGFTLTANVAKDPVTQVQHPTFTSVRLWAPLYQMNPVQEEAYLTLSRIKTIRYSDLFNYTIDVQCSGTPGQLQGRITSLLTNGVPNPQYLVLIPFIGAASNNTGTSTAAIPAYGSPFASEPGTTSPSIILSDLNIQVSGVNVFQQNQRFDFENFSEELALNNAINGSQVDGLNSGLIGFQEFQGNYRYYTINLSRRLPSESAVPKSIQVSATVLSGSISNVTIQAFLVWGRELAIDLETGARVA